MSEIPTPEPVIFALLSRKLLLELRENLEHLWQLSSHGEPLPDRIMVDIENLLMDCASHPALKGV